MSKTLVGYLRPGAGKASQGYFWTYTAPGGDVIFDWHASRATACLDAFLGPAWRGTLQSDGYPWPPPTTPSPNSPPPTGPKNTGLTSSAPLNQQLFAGLTPSV